MCATAGTTYSHKIQASDPSQIRVTVGGSDVDHSIADNGGGNYTVTVLGNLIVHPGPVVIFGATGGDITVTVYP